LLFANEFAIDEGPVGGVVEDHGLATLVKDAAVLLAYHDLCESRIGMTRRIPSQPDLSLDEQDVRKRVVVDRDQLAPNSSRRRRNPRRGHVDLYVGRDQMSGRVFT